MESKDMKEEFKTIEGYEGVYEISNLGNVKSLERIGNAGNLVDLKILKGNIDINHYPTVTLYKNGVGVKKHIHVLIGVAFLNYKTGIHGEVVNHKDYNRENNNLSNLYIGIYDIENRLNHLQKSNKYKGVYYDKIFKDWKIYVITDLGKKIKKFKKEIEASQDKNICCPNGRKIKKEHINI